MSFKTSDILEGFYAVVEMSAEVYDGGEPIALISQHQNYEDASAVAQQCRRPTVDIIRRIGGHFQYVSWVSDIPR